jgi:beta-lactamase superfamily II metal-dependent hydrolase
VVPHHGSRNTLQDGFLEYLDADILICSCSRSQYQNVNLISPNPSGDSLPVKTFYTYRDGAITVDIDKNGTIYTDAFTKESVKPH